ncbi:hypothetical protein Goarm_015603, partial [Gossypium armourianum]|nr:hypothetical protein [Gossypium armourianum]
LNLPTSPGLTRPELALRHGTDAAVFITFGASTTIMGDPISSLELLFELAEGDSHLIRLVELPGQPFLTIQQLGRLNSKSILVAHKHWFHGSELTPALSSLVMLEEFSRKPKDVWVVHVYVVKCRGRNGRAFLFSHAMNITLGPKEDRHLLSGLHTVADIYCADCHQVLGWKYERAYEVSQKYKEGKFILEKAKIVKED